MEDKDRTEHVFKSIKYHLNKLKDARPEYEFVMIAAQGSQNYNLDLYTEEYKSDVDTVAIVLPPVEDIINNAPFVSETIILGNNEHIDVKDLRQIIELFKKQNIKYLEILFTKFRIINSKYKDEVLELLNNADNIAKLNPKKLVTSSFGMQLEKHKALEHPYEGLKEKIAKYGYDGKQLHHIIRLTHFVNRYIKDLDFRNAMNFEDIDDNIYNDLIKAKLNKYSLDMARSEALTQTQRLMNIKDEFVLSYKDLDTSNTLEFLSTIKNKIFNKYLEYKFTPEDKIEKPILIPSADRIFVTSDLHFGHSNILKYEPKRWELTGTTELKAISETLIDEGFTNEEISNMPDDLWDKYRSITCNKYMEKHDKELIRRWNERVKEDDLVFILGDLSFRTGTETNKILKQLKGRKILIKGNHENIWMDKNADLSLFEEIVDYKEIKVDKCMFCMSHYPFRVWNQQHNGSIQLFGHIHSNETTSHPMKEEIPYSYNVGVDVNNYYPVSLKDYVVTTDYFKQRKELNDEYNKLRYGK